MQAPTTTEGTGGNEQHRHGRQMPFLSLLTFLLGGLYPVMKYSDIAISTATFRTVSHTRAEVSFMAIFFLGAALFNLVACFMLKIASEQDKKDQDGTTRSTFLVGCLGGVLSLAVFWISEQRTEMLLAVLTLGMCEATCGIVLLALMVHDIGKENKGWACGVHLCMLRLAELLALLVLPLAMRAATSCTLGGVSSDSTDPELCLAVRHFMTDLHKGGQECICDDMRPVPNIIMSVLLGLFILLGCLYRDHHIGQPPTALLESAAPTNSTASAEPQPEASPTYERHFRSSTAGAGAHIADGRGAIDAFVHASFVEPWLRACMLVLLVGGFALGTIHSSLVVLQSRTAATVQVSSRDMYNLMLVLAVSEALGALLFGHLSDRVNRKAFVIVGLASLLLASFIAATGLAYQADHGFLLGELGLGVIFSGCGSSAIYTAGMAAAYERAPREWRVVALGAARLWWNAGRAAGWWLVDTSDRFGGWSAHTIVPLLGGVLTMLTLIFWIVVYKDERAELGAMEKRPDITALESSEEDSDEEP